MKDNTQMAKDAGAVAVTAGLGALFVARACQADGALWRAGRNAFIAAGGASSVASGVVFALDKTDDSRARREQAAGNSMFWGGMAALVAGGTAGILSLAYDAIRS